MFNRPIHIISIFRQTEGGLIRFRPVEVKCKSSTVDISLKKQFVIIHTHTLRQTEMPALIDSWATNTPSVKMWCPQKKLLLIIQDGARNVIPLIVHITNFYYYKSI